MKKDDILRVEMIQMKTSPVLKINHIAIMVKDLKKAKAFYSTLLNLEELERPAFLIEGLWYKLGESQLHLMLCENSSRPHIHPLNETVQPHFAIALTNEEFNSIMQNLKSAGISYIPSVETNSQGYKQVFVYDFDQNMIEINNEY